MLLARLTCLAALVAVSLSTMAQAPASLQQGAPAPGYTFKLKSQLIVEDVSVVDGKGRPVTGLPRSAFHVFDDNLPQVVSSFREQTLADTPSAGAGASVAEPSGYLSNANLFRDRGTVVAILIDPATIDLQDQMFLRLQMAKFVKAAPEGTAIAVFRANNKGVPVLLQPPTTDKAKLLQTLNITVPVMGRAVDSTFANAIAELGNISDYLRPVPGRKAVLWLAGSFPIYQMPDYTQQAGDLEFRLQAIREAYRALQEARIAVYPIDVRGVLMGGLAPPTVINTQAAANDPSSIPPPVSSQSEVAVGQYDEMDRLAESTGGKAFYSTNAVGLAMSSAVKLATESYALSYEPKPYVGDGKWHKVRITVDGPYTVHYRMGYFAADPGSPEKPERITLTQGGGNRGAIANSDDVEDLAAKPIVFGVRVLPAGKQGKDTRLKVRYVIPTDQLQFTSDAGAERARFRLAVLAYNAWGDVLAHAMDVVETHYSPDQMQLAGRIGTPADQTVEVPKGAQYLLLAVEDLRTEKVGTVTVPLASIEGGKGQSR